MRRREFIAGVGGVVSLPLAAYAQQASTTKRVAILMNLQEGDPEGQARLAAFFQGMRTSGWTQGSNLQADIRWGAGNAERMRKYAAELVALSPDVILAATSTTVDPLQQATRTVPIVFVQFIDPVGSGVVATLSRPGGNATGFTAFEYGTSGKWLELLKRILPRVTRGWRPSGPRDRRGDWSIRSHPSRSPGVRRGINRDGRARRRRYRARHQRIRERRKWRLNRDG
jgi:putative tryptophan/tyrosine transport system substrate-binding protein